LVTTRARWPGASVLTMPASAAAVPEPIISVSLGFGLENVLEGDWFREEARIHRVR
jgi:hypothetical protein